MGTSNDLPASVQQKKEAVIRIELMAPAFEKAIKTGLIIQSVLCILFVLLLDDGHVLGIYRGAWVAQILATAWIVLRRRWSPTKIDLAFVRYGIFFSMFVAILLVNIFRPDY
jgi:hypothetical protein